MNDDAAHPAPTPVDAYFQCADLVIAAGAPPIERAAPPAGCAAAGAGAWPLVAALALARRPRRAAR